MSLSLCMIVKNEEDTIARSIASVKDLTDEIVVVDTGSADKTVEAAESLGARVYYYKWDDSFANARNFALSKAAMDWILVMDADDELEREDKEKLLKLMKTAGENILVYCCRTLCYTGESPDWNNVLINMNVRLIRNRIGCRYRGRVHEQLVFPGEEGLKAECFLATDVRFHHYGYLNSYIQAKDKHARNIRLIRKELEDTPENPFMLFNLGNEYCALQDPERALACYEESYRKFDARESFYAFLLIRMILCHEALGNDDEIFRLARQGLRCYPGHTDFEFLRGRLRSRRGELKSAIGSYRKCIRMGPPPVNASSIAGVATFRAQFALASLYLKLGNRKKALFHCQKTLKLHGGHRAALAMSLDLLLEEGKDADAAARRLAGRLNGSAEAFLLLSDLFYDRGKYKQAQRLSGRALKLDPMSPRALFSLGAASFFLGELPKARRSLKKARLCEEYASRANLLLFFCAGESRRAGENRQPEALDPAHRAAAVTFRVLVSGKNDLPQGMDAKLDAEAVTHVLELLLKAGRLEEFRAALALTRDLEDKDAALRLGKLYFRSGYRRLAWHEFVRSLALGGMADEAALDMMKEIRSSIQAEEREEAMQTS